MPTPPLHVGLTVPQIKRSWDEAKDAAIEFERLGFDSVWVCDHLLGVPVPDLPILEAWSLLTGLAASTSRLGLGTLVTPPFFRNPTVLAKQIATIDHIAGGGRVVAGLGAGWMRAEFDAYGCAFPAPAERYAALAETAELLRRLWTEPATTYEGRWARAVDARCEPKPSPSPPILIGGSGEKRLLRLAARHADIWNNPSTSQGDLAHKIGVLRQHCDDVGRDPAEIVVSQQCTVIIAEDESGARAALEKAARVYGPAMAEPLADHGIWGHPARVVDRIGEHLELGCSHLIVELFGRDTREPAALLAEAVLPVFAT